MRMPRIGRFLLGWRVSRIRSVLRWLVVLVLFGLTTHGHFAASGDAEVSVGRLASRLSAVASSTTARSSQPTWRGAFW